MRSFFSLRRFLLVVAAVGTCAIAVGVITGAGAALAVDGACSGYGTDRPNPSFVYEPLTPKVGESVTFTSTSTSPDGVILEESWDLDGDFDNSNPDFTKFDAVGHSVAHTYGAPGDYRVTLRVDNACGFSLAQQVVHVAPKPQTNPPPDTTPPDTTPPDTTSPALRALDLSATVFRAARSGPSTSATRPIGTKVTYSLSEPGKVRFSVDRKSRGRKVGTRCRAQTRANRNRRACTRWVKVKGSFTVTGKAGKNSFKFRGRIGGTSLKPGSYRLNGQAADAANNRSAVKRNGFKIVR
jgi:plastocyanin